jgi:hypothetical protein
MKTIVVTPAGRQRYLEVLLQCLLNVRDEFDRWNIWLNTTNQEDIAYIERIAAEHDFISISYPKIPVDGNQSIYHFFEDCVSPDEIYVRLDDDIVYIGKGSIRRLAEERMIDSHSFLLYGNIVNNAIMTHLHQRTGAIGHEAGSVGYACMDPTGWNNPAFAEHVHRTFIGRFYENTLDAFKLADSPLWNFERTSINAICWSGRDFSQFGGKVCHYPASWNMDEEQWLSVDRPRMENRPNKIVGDTLFVHYSFFTQRAHLDNTDLLQEYRKIAFMQT